MQCCKTNISQLDFADISFRPCILHDENTTIVVFVLADLQCTIVVVCATSCQVSCQMTFYLNNLFVAG